MHHPIEAEPAVGAPVADGGVRAGAPAVARAGRAAHTLPGLTIVLPCFNEAENVADAIRYATDRGRALRDAHEIVVVDDGSSDATAAIAARFADRDRRRAPGGALRQPGYGDALRSGIAAAQMPWVLLTDADLQFDLDDLEDFLPLAAQADLVAGWRILRQDPLEPAAQRRCMELAGAPRLRAARARRRLCLQAHPA